VALSKLAANSFDLTDNYAFTGTTTGATSTQKLFLIKNLDASSSGTLSFVDGSSSVVLDNTYKTYLFRFINIHPSQDNDDFVFNGSTDSGSNYNVTKTTTLFNAFTNEAGDDTGLEYISGQDLAQSTGFQQLTNNSGADNDQNEAGELWLFNPSSTTFVKHFIAVFNNMTNTNFLTSRFLGGYFNTTSAIDALQFKFSGGNIDSGRIALYGIK